MRQVRRCKYVTYSVKSYNVIVGGKHHSTHFTLDAAIKEALKVGRENTDKGVRKSIVVIKNMGHIECKRR